ncbi:MAG: hypothetical protein M3227_07140 [Thermoproteota archaeon]|nr:hypothetical protein [Thermoproteota archaeon]
MKIHYMISKYLVYLIISKLDFHWLMKSQPTQHNFTKGLLLAAAIVFSLAATGVFASTAIPGQQYPFLAFAQQELGIPDTTTDTDTTTTTTTTADNATDGTTTTATDTATTTGGNKVAGIIASLQLAPDRLAPEWVTAGYWELESDMPLFGGTTETRPTVTNFDAIVEMVHLADGTALHSHTFSDFRQTDIVSGAENTTTISGTMTVSLQEGPVQNVPVFITLQNNLLSIAMDPAATENHFGPTPVSGMILAPEHLQEISSRLAPTAAEAGGGGEGGTETGGQQEEDSASVVTGPTGSLTGQ